MGLPKQEPVEPYFTIGGESYEGKYRALIVAPDFRQSPDKFEISIVDNSGKVMGAASIHIDDFVDAIPKFPALKRALIDAVRFEWRP